MMTPRGVGRSTPTAAPSLSRTRTPSHMGRRVVKDGQRTVFDDGLNRWNSGTRNASSESNSAIS
jgi:hypothetical protein